MSRVLAQSLLAAGSLAFLGAMAHKTFLHVAEHADQMPTLVSPGATASDVYQRARKYPVEFERFFESNIAWRDIQVRRFARYKLGWFGVSATPRVWLGDDGWLLYNHDVEPCYMAANDPRLADRLDEWATTIPIWRDWLAERNIRLLFVIAPDKQSIYPEHLPAHVRKSRVNGTPLDRLMKAFHEHDVTLEVLDLRSDLIAAKPVGQLYFRTDTHWTLYGARAGYQATARRLGFVPCPDSDFNNCGPNKRDGDLARIMLGNQHCSAEPYDDVHLNAPTAKEVPWQGADDGSRLDYMKAFAWNRPGGTGKCLIFHDSFGLGYYSTLLAEHFGDAVAVPSNHMDPKLIEAEKPTVVVLEMVERVLQATSPRKPTDPPRRSVTK